MRLAGIMATRLQMVLEALDLESEASREGDR
jgi:hypothetical protein